jgi:hypothetical protein
MTSKTNRKPKHRHKAPRRRNSMMESLGFSESKSTSYATRGRHSPPIGAGDQPAREAPLHPDPMVDSVADWAPIEFDRSGLNQRMRWSLVVMWLVVLGIVGGAAYWLYEGPNASAENAVAAVTVDASTLVSSLEALETVAATLDPASLEPSSESVAATADVDDASRELFSSSGELSAGDSSLRLAATDASTHALDASRTLSTSMSYIAAVSPILTAPTLETDPEAIDLATAATDFGSWISRFDQVRNALPDSVLSQVTAELDRISNSLETTQRAYLDALREDDREAALEVVRGLEGSMLGAWTLLVDEVDELRQSILGRIESARQALDSLG